MEHKLPLITLLGLVALAATSNAEVRYVDDDGPVAGDGLTWNTAHRFLREALDEAAANPAITEIRIAQGTYLTDRTEFFPGGTFLRTDSFVLADGVDHRGGYAGIGAPDPDVRDSTLYVTILSGDIDEDGIPDDTDDALRVVTGDLLEPGTRVDGVTIRDGYGKPNPNPLGGGGVVINGGNVAFHDCLFTANCGQNGAVLNLRSMDDVSVTDSRIIGNAGLGAVAMWISGDGPASTCLIQDCMVTDNDATGALIHIEDMLTTVSGLVATSNVSREILRQDDGRLLVEQSQFIDNTGTAILSDCELSELYDCTIDQHIADDEPGIDLKGDAARVEDCTVINNESTEGWVSSISTGDSRVNDVVFMGNESASDAGAVRMGGTFRLEDVSFRENIAAGEGGAVIVIASATGVFDRCEFIDNVAATGGAAAIGSSSGAGNDLEFINCRFISNDASVGGGAILIRRSSNRPTFTNNVFIGNTTSGVGGVLLLDAGSPTLLNCTLTANIATVAGGAVYVSSQTVDTTPTFTNSIVWQNPGAGGVTFNDQFTWPGPGDFVISGSALQDLPPAYMSDGNIQADPQFTDLDGADDSLGTADDSAALSLASACIDAANAAGYIGVFTDAVGNIRLADVPFIPNAFSPSGGLDIGAHEYPFNAQSDCPGDADGDGGVDFDDLNLVLSNWNSDCN